MVSVNPNPPSPPQSLFFSSPSLDPMHMALPGLSASPIVSSSAGTATAMLAVSTGFSASDDPSKKIRKPYTITKSRESWTEQEHEKFLEALQLFDRDWKKIEAFVGSKTVIQIRSHAQKYFLKVQKNGTSEHVPPPRPKRKAAHPYPQKASKNAPVASKGMDSFQSSSSMIEPGYILRPDSTSVLGNSNTALSPWTYNLPSVKSIQLAKDAKEQARPAYNNCCSSSNENLMDWPSGETHYARTQNQSLRAMPDFVQVYNFLGSVFDPDASDHLQNLRKMDPINMETVLLLMRNLSVNLTSPEFEDHRNLLASYDADPETPKPSNSHNDFQADELENAISSAER